MDEWEIPELKCRKCGHKWLPRRNRPPKVCPKCKREDWNDE